MEFRTTSRQDCPLCGTTSTEAAGEVWDDRFGQPDSYQLRMCPACDFAFLAEIVAADDVGKLYAKYYPRQQQNGYGLTTWSDGLLVRLARWLDGNINPAYTIRQGEQVLDVGCGTGVGLEIGRLRGAQAEGLEVDENAVGQARSRGLICHLGTLDNCPALTGRRYDRIVMDQVLEHLPDPVDTLRRCLALLEPHGMIVIAAPHLNGLLRSAYGRRWISWHAPYHANHFSRRALERAAALAGLAVRNFRLRTPGNWILAQLRMGQASRGQPNGRFRARFPFWQRTMLVPVGRLMDVAGRGEGFLAVLEAARRKASRESE